MKYFTLFLLTIIFSTILSAQVPGGYGGKTSNDDNMHKLDIGVTTGPSMIMLYGNEIIDDFHKPAIGFSGGLTLQYNFRKIFSVHTGIGYERKGSRVNSTITYTDVNGNNIGTDKLIAHIHFDYVAFPVLIRASLGKQIKYFVNAGGYGGYLLKQQNIFEPTKYSPGIKTEETDNYNRFDAGFVAGVGLSIPIKDKFAVSCEIRNNLGLYNTSALPVYENGTIKTNSTNLLFSFVYKFGMRHYIIPA